jgi:hypothetical protein
VWGSELTTKDAALQGEFIRIRSYDERKIVGSGGDWWWWRDPGFLEQLSIETKSRRGAGRFEY